MRHYWPGITLPVHCRCSRRNDSGLTEPEMATLVKFATLNWLF